MRRCLPENWNQKFTNPIYKPDKKPDNTNLKREQNCVDRQPAAETHQELQTK